MLVAIASVREKLLSKIKNAREAICNYECISEKDFSKKEIMIAFCCALYRLKEIERFLNQAKRNCASSSSLMKEIRPGIRQIDLETLNQEQWLNDIVVNKYMSLLCRAKPWACCASSFFYDVLQRRGKHTLPEEWFEKKYFLIPMCIKHHWSLLCVMPSDHCVKIYNSLSSSESERKCALVS